MTKSECRILFTQRRQELSEEKKNLLSKKIIDRLLNFIDLSNKTISLYLPIAKKHEIDTWLLIKNKLLSNTQFVSTISDFKTSVLTHILVDQTTKFTTNSWGIPEPISGERINVDKIDLVIVPLLAFDLMGFRVGYGKGFYDRFLASCRKDCLFLGLSFFEPIDKISDLTKYDIPLNIAITADKVYTFNSLNVV